MLNKMFDEIEKLYKYDEIILGVNHQCNLKCKFCYITYDNFIETKEMDLEEYSRLIYKAKDIGITRFKIAEREPFCSAEKTFAIINLIRDIYSKTPFKNIQIDLVTNGILVEENIGLALSKKVKIDNMIFSLDGFDKTHRFLRSFTKNPDSNIVKQILKSAKKCKDLGVTKSIKINSVLNKYNYKEIPKLIKYINVNYKCISSFSIDIFNYNPLLNNQFLQTNKEEFLKFVNSIRDLSSDEKIIIDLIILGNKQMKKYLDFLYNNDYLNDNDDIDSNLLYVANVNDSFRIYYQLFPTEYIRNVRVSSDGFVMGIGNEILKGDYQKYAIGNVKDKTLKTLWDNVRKSSLKLLLEEYFNT